jgi:light-regulated signal transduction histidine kinase (bacteriophytochrome)
VAVRAAGELERKQAEEALQRTAEKLARSNKDLEQFAYVASHDLQEPLRQVTGFMQLLRDRYAGKLDERAIEYIQYGVDGASRMSNLIRDLLDYSRVGASDKQPGEISCQEALDRALANLGTALSDSSARVTHDSLPTLVANSGQITQLLQNLVGNAIKFRREGVDPEVHVGARQEGDQWVLWVRDNGIGIPPEQFDRVFVIFQRLHSRSKYLGTGIGLAICKKIVQRHGGRIWVESKVGEGSTFYFTLPAARPA